MPRFFIRTLWQRLGGLRLVLQGVRLRLLLLTVACMVGAVLVYGIYMASAQARIQQRDIRAEIGTVAHSLAAIGAVYLATEDYAELESTVSRFGTDGHQRALRVTNTEGKALLHLVKEGKTWAPVYNTVNAGIAVAPPQETSAQTVVHLPTAPPGHFQAWLPIREGITLGWVSVLYVEPSTAELIYSHLLESIWVLVAAGVGAVLLFSVVLHKPTQALLKATEFARHLDENMGVVLPPYPHSGEIRDLGLALNAVSQKLQFHETALQNRQFAVDQHAIVSIVDLDRKIVHVNDKFCEISGYSRAEILGQTHRLLASKAQDKALYREMWQTLESGSVWHGEIVNQSKGGQTYWTEATLVPLFDGNGQPCQYIGIQTDVTARKAAEDAAKAASRSKSDFLANMSHEIRTPMNGVVGMAEIVLQSDLEPQQRRAIETIHESALNLLALLNDILDLSKVEADKLEIEILPTPLRDVIEGAARQSASTLGAANARLTVFVSPDLPEWVDTDPNRLRQALLNLLGNALKFSAGQPDRQARVHLNAQPMQDDAGNAWVQIQVRDNGIGMTQAVVQRLFQPFTQGDESTSRRFGGTGLGLSITHRLVLLLGGSIQVHSTPGAGSVFDLQLPLRPSTNAGTPRTRPQLGNAHVVVISRDEALCDIVSSYAKSVGARVSTVMHLEVARALLPHTLGGMSSTVLLLGPDFDPTVTPLTALEKSMSVQLTYPNPAPTDDNITVCAAPITYVELLQALAQASGRLAQPAQSPPAIARIPAPAAPAPSVEQAAAANRLILLAEDNATNRLIMRLQLEQLGYTCEMAEDGAIALDMWRAGHYALLLTDCHMPNLDGFGLTEAIRASEPPGTRLPIIAVTANAMQGQAERCCERGMDGYLSKPLRLQELRTMLERWLPLPAAIDPGATSVAPPPTTNPVWDVSVLTGLVGNNPLLCRRLLTRYLEDGQKEVAAIAAAATEGAADLLAGAAHTLKSSSKSVGALALAALCQTIETAGQSHDLTQVQSEINQLPSLFAAVHQAISNHVAATQPPSA